MEGLYSIKNIARHLVLPMLQCQKFLLVFATGLRHVNRLTDALGAGSRYLHSSFFSLQLLHGLSSSHFAFN